MLDISKNVKKFEELKPVLAKTVKKIFLLLVINFFFFNLVSI